MHFCVADVPSVKSPFLRSPASSHESLIVTGYHHTVFIYFNIHTLSSVPAEVPNFFLPSHQLEASMRAIRLAPSFSQSASDPVSICHQLLAFTLTHCLTEYLNILVLILTPYFSDVCITYSAVGRMYYLFPYFRALWRKKSPNKVKFMSVCQQQQGVINRSLYPSHDACWTKASQE